MKRHGNRARLGGVLLAVGLGALALLALPALGIGKGGDGPRAAGTVESFDRETGLLVVDLAKGRKIAGLVVRRTKIRCARHDRRHQRARRRAQAAQRDVAPDRVAPAADRERGEEPPRRDGEGAEVDAEAPELGEEPGTDKRRPKRCIDALVPGAVVKRAEMVLAHGNAFYKKIGVLPAPAVEATG